MYEILVKGDFSSAHNLRGYKGRCEELHGHNWKVEARFEKADLNDIGISVDFTELKSMLKDILKKLDHTYLNKMSIFKKEDVEAVVIGCFTSNKRLKLRYNGNVVCDLDMEFLHNGIPRFKRKAVWSRPGYKESENKGKENFTRNLLRILSSWNVCSKEWVIRQYDHEVQGKAF